MVSLTSCAVQLALGGSYYDAVIADTPAGFWLLNEQLSATGARDSSGNARHGTYTNVVFGFLGPFPYGGTAINVAAGRVDWGDLAAFEFAGAFSIEGMFQTRSTNQQSLVSKVTWSNTKGYWLGLNASGQVRFFASTSVPAAIFDVATPLAYNDDAWHHIVATWDGTTAADKVQIYIDGALVQTATAAAGSPGYTTERFLVAAADDSGADAVRFVGQLAGLAVYGSEVSAASVTTHYAATQWTDVTGDTHSASGLSVEYGTQGGGPLDRLANAGTLTFTLQNGPSNSAGLHGYYSPNHANLRSGFAFDIPVRVQFTYAGVTYTKFWGRLAVIDPIPGQYGEQVTHCIAHDYLFLLVDTDVREIAEQIDQNEATLIKTVFEALPPTLQPMALDLDAAVETYTYAFYDLEGGVKAATAINNVLISAWGLGFVKGDGTFRYVNRQAREFDAIEFVLDNSMVDLESPSDRSNIFDHIRVTVHPKAVDAAATTVLYAHPNASDLFVAAAGGTREIWATYGNPTDDYKTTIGGTAMVAPVSGTDFVANSAADGSGTALTADVTVVATFFASVAKIVLTNNHATLGAYFTTLQVRGKGIYDLLPVTLEALGTRATRPLTIDLPYQTSAAVGQDLADFILGERETITNQIDAVSVIPQSSNVNMLLAVDGEPGEMVSITEAQTGLTEAQALVRSIRLDLSPKLWLSATIGLVPVVVGEGWLLETVGRGELDLTTVLGAG